MIIEDLNFVPIQACFIGKRRFRMADDLTGLAEELGAALITTEDSPDDQVPSLTVKVYYDEHDNWKSRSSLLDEMLTVWA